MTASNLSKQYGMAAISFGLVGGIIYLLMINVTLAHIEGVSGQVPFDMRPFGYGQLEAGKLLDGLGENGRRTISRARFHLILPIPPSSR